MLTCVITNKQSMSSSQQHNRRPWSRGINQGEPQDPRRALAQRTCLQSAQIRKRRKDEILLEKRLQLQRTVVPHTQAQCPPQEQQQQQQPLSAALPVSPPPELQAFLDGPSDLTIKALVANDNNDAIKSTLFQLIEFSDQHGACIQLIHGLLSFFMDTQQQNEESRRLALKLIEFLVSTSTSSSMMTGESYYGSRCLGWSDVLCENDDTLSLLVSRLPLYPAVVGEILSHVFMDCTKANSAIPILWPRIAAALPASASVCAVMLKCDATTPGSVFLQDLRSESMIAMLQDPATATSAAWMVEGLTRREDAVVDYLFHSPAFVSSIVLKILQPAATSSAALLLPTIRSIGNMVVACQGKYLPVLLETSSVPTTSLPCALLEVLRVHGHTAATTLSSAYSSSSSTYIAEEALWAMSCCLYDAGRPHQRITDQVAPLWIPHIVSLCVSSCSSTTTTTTTFSVQRQAIHALWMALSMPPDVECWHERNAIQAQLDTILHEYVWKASANRNAALIENWVRMMNSVDDTSLIVTILRILQRLVDAVPESKEWLQSCHVVDALEVVIDRNTRTTLASDLASNLSDQLRDDDEEEEDEDENEIFSAGPSILNGSFSFGLHTADESSLSNPIGVSTPLFMAGRGRGRTVPAWMERTKSDQTT